MSNKQVSSENISEYFRELQRHDWYYEYSDDHSVWKRGSDERTRLTQKKEYVGGVYHEMYSEFYNWYRGEREQPTLEEFIDEV